MLVFPVLALAEIVSILRNDTICATFTACTSPISPATVLDTKATLMPARAFLFDHFSFTTLYPTESGDTWGDSIHDAPGNLHRVYFQNIDGLRNDTDEIALYISSMALLQVGTFCWADPGLDFSNPPIRARLLQPLRHHFTAARSAFSSSVLPETAMTSSSGYQPGGTFMTSTDRWGTRSTGTPLIDPSGMGRWSGLRYLGKQGKRLSIITAYCSPRQQPSGGFGFFDQQYAILLSKGVTKPNVQNSLSQIWFCSLTQCKATVTKYSFHWMQMKSWDKILRLASPKGMHSHGSPSDGLIRSACNL